MSINSQMQKIVNFSSKIVGALNYKSVGINIPSNNFFKALGIQGDLSFNSLTDVMYSLQELKQGAATGYNMFVCAYTIGTSWSQFSSFLGQLMDGVVGAMSSCVDQIWDAIACQITGVITQVVNSFLNIIDAFQSLITSVVLLMDSIKNFVLGLGELAHMKWETSLKQEQCRNFFASIAACFLNKYLGPYLDQFTNKAVEEINKVGGDINNLLYEELQDVNVFASYAKKEAFLMKKASLQINGLTPSNLLG